MLELRSLGVCGGLVQALHLGPSSLSQNGCLQHVIPLYWSNQRTAWGPCRKPEGTLSCHLQLGGLEKGALSLILHGQKLGKKEEEVWEVGTGKHPRSSPAARCHGTSPSCHRGVAERIQCGADLLAVFQGTPALLPHVRLSKTWDIGAGYRDSLLCPRSVVQRSCVDLRLAGGSMPLGIKSLVPAFQFALSGSLLCDGHTLLCACCWLLCLPDVKNSSL